MKYPMFLFLALGLIMSCGKDDSDGKYCYSFDLRSCQGDAWNKEENQGVANKDEKTRIAEFLNNKGIDISKVAIDPSFHEVVCLACYVCPSGARVYIQTNKPSLIELQDLDLLSLQEADCTHKMFK